MAFIYCFILFGMVILREGGSMKAFSHYFALFLHYEKLVIYTSMVHVLISIDVLSA